jgi:hypothetical protein
LKRSCFTYSGTEGQQIPTPVECGEILESELTADDIADSNTPTHTYTMRLNAGDTVTVRGERIGDFLTFIVKIYGIQGNSLTADTSSGGTAQIEAKVPATGQYQFYVYGYRSTDVGAYQVFFGCVFRDGTVIAPGDSPIVKSDSGGGDTGATVITPDPNIYGFPGLAPVDFTNGVTIPLTANAPNIGSISTGFEGIFGYSFSAEAGQAMSLDFARTAGNLNLGIVLLSADNQVAFQASLVTSTTLSTELVIPVGGEYTLGVFRIDLIPPLAPENTAFTLTATLN